MNSKRHPRNIVDDVRNPKKPFQFIIAYVIVDPCVITEHQILKSMHVYDLVDFLDDGEIELKEVKFINANKVDDTLKITVVDLKTKVVMQRSKLINGGACNWVVTDLFTSPEDIITDYCEKGR